MADGSIIIDTKINIKNAKSDMKGLTAEIQATQQQMDMLVDNFMRMQKGIALTDQSMEGLVEQFKANSKEYSDLVEKQKQLTDEVNKYASALTSTDTHTEKVSANIDEQNKAWTGVAHSIGKIKIDTKNLEKTFKGIGNSITRGAKSLVRFGLALVGIRGVSSLIRSSISEWASSGNAEAKQLQANLSQLKQSIASGLLPVINAVLTVFYKILGVVNAIVKAFTGVDFLAKSTAKSTGATAKNAKGALASFDEINTLNKTDGGGTGDIAGNLQDIELDAKTLETIEKIKELTERMQENFKKILGDINRELQPIVAPLAETMVNDILPVTAKVANEMVKTFDTASKNIGSGFKTAWKGAISPALQEGVKIWGDMWQDIHNAWNKYGTPIFDSVRTAINNIGETFQNIWDNFLQPIFDNFMNMIDWLWENHLRDLWQHILDFGATVSQTFLDILNNVLLPIFNFLIRILGPSVSNIINTITNIVGTLFATITDIVDGLIQIFTGLIEIIDGIFTGDLSKVMDGTKKIFKGAWDAIVGVVKGAINLIIDMVNGMIGAIENGLNFIVDAINKLEITNPFTGEEVWSPHVDRFNLGRIPKLARGGIAYQPTQAIIGDAGREAVLPLDRNTEWMEDLAEMISQNQSISVNFEGNLSQLARVLNPAIKKEQRRTGARLIGGAV